MSALPISIYPVTHTNGYTQDYGPFRIAGERARLVRAPEIYDLPLFSREFTAEEKSRSLDEALLRIDIWQQHEIQPVTTYQSPEVTNNRRARLVMAKELVEEFTEDTAAGVDDGYGPSDLRPYLRDLAHAVKQAEKACGTGGVIDLVARVLSRKEREYDESPI